MNERIQKLAKKAGATINEGFDGNKDFVYGITMSPEECEKFAKLIVKECINIAKEYESRGHEPYSETLKHFGVEE